MIRYICGSCGYVLYEFKSTRGNYAGIIEPRRIAEMYNFKCPRCGKKLEPPRDKLQVVVKRRELGVKGG